MVRPLAPSPSPAASAAGLLRRVGFALIVVAAPLLAVGSRRGLVIAAPMGIALMVLATIIETEGRQPLVRAWRGLRSTPGAIALFLAFWAALSLIWTPFPGAAAERVMNLVAIGGVGLVASAALPERMRVSNLYLLPIGVGLAALLAIGIGGSALFTGKRDPSLAAALNERGLLLIVIMTPAAVTWLLSKDRMVSGFLLVAVATAGLVLTEAYAGLIGLAAGAIVFAIATANATLGRRVAMILIPGLVLAAPIVPFVLRPLSKLVYGVTHAKVDTIRVWCRLVTDDPLRLFTGHGFDTALRAKLAGIVPAAAPRGLLFDLWFELGILGAIALALLLVRAIAATRLLHPAVAPGALMTLTVAFVLAVAGQGAAQAWWLTGLAVAPLVILAVDKGQYRTSRPKSASLGPAVARPRL